MNIPPPQSVLKHPTGPTLSPSSQLHSPVSLSTEHDGDYVQEPGSATQDLHRNLQQRSKRKRSQLSRGLKKDERKKVSRACDSCKLKKIRCSGTQPCTRCNSQAVRCEYNAEHRRGRPASPEPAPPYGQIDQGVVFPSTPRSQRLNLGESLNLPTSSHVNESFVPHEPRKSSRSSPEADETRFEGDYIGPTSGIAFLHRAQRRFQQDFVDTMSSNASGQGSAQASVFSFGDGWSQEYSPSDLVFPKRQQAKHLLDRYFDFAMPTYRFLHRTTVEGWLEITCDENEAGALHGQSLSSAKIAILLLILATAKLYGEAATGVLHDGDAKDFEESGVLFAAAEQKLSTETGPVRLESVQARLAQCIYLLASSRINQAWYIFGTATQMILALGLHRKRYSQSSGATSGLIEIECRKRVFWSAYTLDKYLSVILGRPRIFRDDDVDQHLPDRLNDSDLTLTSGKARSMYNQCVSDGPVFHAKLAKIIGGISSDLYPTNSKLGTNWMECAKRWTTELKAWKESLPAFLEPSKVDPSILVPIFQRQSTVLRLAYAHALILANRPSLLSNFADLSRRQDFPSGEPEGSVKECIEAAILVVDTVNGFIDEGKMCKAFWFTHYISFCAIAALYVYTIQQSIPRNPANLQSASDRRDYPYTQHFDAAEKCQRSIVETTTKTSPFRRYNIILDELKREVLQRLGRTSANMPIFSNRVNIQRPIAQMDGSSALMGCSRGTPSRGTPSRRTPSRGLSANGTYPLDFGISERSLNLPDTELLSAQNYGSVLPGHDSRTSGTSPGRDFDVSMLELGPFGPQVDLIGWSEFDACAITWPDAFGSFDPGVEIYSHGECNVGMGNIGVLGPDPIGY